MTVSSINITSGPYAGNDVATAFAYDFRIEEDSQLLVYETDDEGVVTELTLTTDYTVSDAGEDAGGEVTRVAGALPTGYTWFFVANYDFEQNTAFASQGGFFPAIHEAAFDKLSMINLQQREQINKSVRFADSYSGGASTELSAPSAGAYLRWNNAGTALINDTEGATIITISGDVATVAAIAANVTAVAGIDAEVVTVAGIAAAVVITAAVDAEISTVAGIAAAISTVAGIAADVTLLADNIADIIIAASNAVLNNYDATTAPTADDDGADTSGNGVFGVGSEWVNVTSGLSYKCVDVTTGAAVWTGTNAGGGSILNSLKYE